MITAKIFITWSLYTGFLEFRMIGIREFEIIEMAQRGF